VQCLLPSCCYFISLYGRQRGKSNLVYLVWWHNSRNCSQCACRLLTSRIIQWSQTKQAKIRKRGSTPTNNWKSVSSAVETSDFPWKCSYRAQQSARRRNEARERVCRERFRPWYNATTDGSLCKIRRQRDRRRPHKVALWRLCITIVAVDTQQCFLCPSSLSHKRHDSWGKMIPNKIVFWFSKTLSETWFVFDRASSM
jgi:hypothetical protein